MGFYYLETSALVKLYVREPGTQRMIQLAASPEGHTLAVLALSRVELRAAVRRRQRAGDIDSDVAAALIARLEGHLQNLYLIQPLTEAVLEQASALLDRHSLRAYDAVQLAGCLALRARLVAELPWFVCSDQQLLSAAVKEGLAVMDPATESAR